MREMHLEDPSFEPTDEELVGLSKRAFAHVPEQNRALLAKIDAEIAELRVAVLARILARRAGGGQPPP
jgi:hypothetical protein